MMLVEFGTLLSECDWIPAQRARLLDRFGLQTIEQLVHHFPKRHEDRRQFDRFPHHETDVALCLCGKVKKTAIKRLPGWKKLFEVTLVEDENTALSEPLICRWFNLHWVEKVIATGHRLVVYGRPKLRGGKVCIDHPEFEVVEEEDEGSVHLRRITPVHPATEGLSTRVIRATIHDALERLPDDAAPTRLPAGLDPTDYATALRHIHFPESWESLAAAKRHLVLDEFFAMQLLLASKRAESVARPGAAHAGPGALMKRLHESLPFPLTNAQHRTIAEIRRDLASPRPMNRLLHGDVGSGKTLVAFSAMLLAAEAGFQAALMAPTQILAEQHYLNAKRLLDPLGISLALRTGSRKEETTALPLFAGAEPEAASAAPGIIIGTHALLFEESAFQNLGLVVIDEQHKFGVMQRARLIQQGVAPDVLVMTATPIPRTYTMTIYGDLDVSTLDEMPSNRSKIITALRKPDKLPDAIQFIRKQLEEGRQAYVVYPLIEESEKLTAKAATQEFETWSRHLAPMKCGLLHGRIDTEEKDALMERFRKGEIQALIATTVIEVGIDVPNASIMLIESAERFGLAQLHQLRGRVGRGPYKSYCVLISEAAGGEALEKLQTLERTTNGFEIAEADLRLRGPGDILGTAQSGLPPLKLGDPLTDAELMQAARQAAQEIFERDPKLTRKENQHYRDMIAKSRRLLLSQVS